MHAKAGHQPGMAGDGWQRSEHVRREITPPLGKWQQELAPCFSIRSKPGFRSPEIAFQSNRRAVVKGVREGSWRVNPFQSMVSEWQGRKEGRASAHRMHGCSEVVEK